MTDPKDRTDPEPDLLVFLANDTLEGDERQKQERAVAEDPELEAELAALWAIREKMQASDPVASPGEFGLARLMRDVRAERAAAQPANRGGMLWKAAAVAAVMVLAIQNTAPYLSNGPVAELADGGSSETPVGAQLTVAFVASATEGDIRSLLLELDLVIVSGPSALGLYQLVARDEAAAQQAAERLGLAVDLVESVELEAGR